MRTKQSVASLCLTCALVPLATAHAQAPTETILHTFGFFPGGFAPCATLIIDPAGNLYGTTNMGGADALGVVFEREVSGTYRTLYSFKGGTDGSSPFAGVFRDAAGNLYGTTTTGGTANAGVVYKLTASGQETILYNFLGGADGANPYAGVIADAAGDLYGTTNNGGPANAGTVYKISSTGQKTVLYSFTGTTDGGSPYAAPTLDPAGNLYGTTELGGAKSLGVVYKISAAGQEMVIYSFGTGGEGSGTQAGVILDAAGTIYGVNAFYVFKISPAGVYTQLAHLFKTGGPPRAALAMDAAGNLYGTCSAAQEGQQSDAPAGSVFKVDPLGNLTVLYYFNNKQGGGGPIQYLNPGVVLDAAGNVYGDSSYDGTWGDVYEISAAGQETALHGFQPAPGGTQPFGALLRDARGNLYGTTATGGPNNQGLAFKLSASGETVLPPNAGTAGRGLAWDAAGNLYLAGGSSLTALGNIYKVTPSGQSTVLYSFTGRSDGNSSQGVTLDSAGNLYGISSGSNVPNGLVFKLTQSGQFTVLHTFTGGNDGSTPNYQLTLDRIGNVYGTTAYGSGGGGMVYRISPIGVETVLHSFNGVDGANPSGGVTFDSFGNLCGATASGGSGNLGVVYKLSPTAGFQILHTFLQSETGGSSELGNVALDSEGNIFGTASFGGDLTCDPIGCGVVYELTPTGVYTVLHAFAGGTDGIYPEAGVILDAHGSLYGTTSQGGASGVGVIYKITR
jgi:uncharacterized repeat protein (TIGR03803 family)